MKSGAELTRFLDKIEIGQPADCWEWRGGRTGRNYGAFHVNGRTLGAHRVSFEHFIGPIPEGLQIDHLCRNTVCVNPYHLEAVTPQENFLRSLAPTAIAANTNMCLRGHALVPGNLSEWRGTRCCRTCRRVGDARRKREYRKTSAYRRYQKRLQMRRANQADFDEGAL